MRLSYKLLITLVFLFTVVINAQIESLLPIHTTPQILIDQSGKIITELPDGERIIASLKGKSDYSWLEGVQIGNCGNVVTYNSETKEHSIYNIQTHRKRTLPRNYSNITPCINGYHIAKISKKTQFGDFIHSYIFLDETGKRMFNTKGYSKVDNFNEGITAVKTNENKWLYINEYGQELDIIPKSIGKIKNATTFYGGLSIITALIPGNSIRNTYQIYMINKEGEIIFDSQKLNIDTPIKRVARVQNGITALTLYKEDYIKDGERIIHINNQGKKILETNHAVALDYSKSDFIFTTYKNKIKPSTTLHTNEGKKVEIPKFSNKKHLRIHHINDHYYKIMYKLRENEYQYTIFDAKKGKNVYLPKDDVIAIKGNLIYLNDFSTKRHYVINVITKEIVYDTDLSDQTIYDIPNSMDSTDLIKTFYCRDLKDIKALHTLTELQELTIRIENLKELPNLRNLKKLKILRLDNCRQLKTFPAYLNTLSKLSIRNCISTTNVMEMIDAQTELNTLTIINIDLNDADKQRLKNKYPNSYIEGNSENAKSKLEEYIEGF